MSEKTSLLSGREPFFKLHSEIERAFDHVFKGFGSHAFDFTPEPLMPDLDLCETEKGHYISIELPGVNEKDIEIELLGDTLVVHGKKCFEETSNTETKGYHICERSYGEFYRSVPLGTIVNAGLIDARLSSGVLRIFVPKVKEQSVPAKKIAIKSSSD